VIRRDRMWTVWDLLTLSSDLSDRLHHAVDQFIAVGWGLLEGVVVYGIAWLASRMIRRPLRRRLRRSELPENIQALLLNFFRVAMFLIATTLLFAVWGLTLSGFLAAVSVSTIILALGFQSALQSFLAGTFILLERPFGVGDRIKFSGQDIEGVVTEIGMRTITLKNDHGERITAPNALIFSLGVTNLTPNRAAKTIVRITDVQGDAAQIRRTIDEAIALEPAVPKPVEIRFRTRLARTRIPFDEFSSDLPASLGKAAQSVVNRTRDAEIVWTGLLPPAVLDSAIARLQSAFPGTTVTSRHR
jgi:small-conductance mechanosensitive channel